MSAPVPAMTDTLNHELSAVAAAWERDLLPGTAARMAEIAGRYARRLAVTGVASFAAATPVDCAEFITAPGRQGRRPAVATQHFRRATLRALYRQLRLLGLAGGDPTLDLAVARRPPSTARPLTDDEIRLCRAHTTTVTDVHGGRRAAAWALAEVGATTGEIPQVTVDDLDHPTKPGHVRLPGGRGIASRRVPLTAWGATALSRHLARWPHQPGDRLTYRGSGGKTGSNSPLARSCQQVVAVIAAAGLGDEPGVRPASVRHWAGRHAYDQGATLADVAHLLGLPSLDTTARRIGIPLPGDPAWSAR